MYGSSVFSKSKYANMGAIPLKLEKSLAMIYNNVLETDTKEIRLKPESGSERLDQWLTVYSITAKTCKKLQDIS